jgi:enamine deaminase RidA (YjgF/YER057c/UK114 family)
MSIHEEVFVKPIQRSDNPGFSEITLKTTSHEEHFLCALPEEDASPESMLSAVAEASRDAGASLLTLEVFGGPHSGRHRQQLLGDVFGDCPFPVTWIEEASGPEDRLAGVQAWAVSGVPVEPVLLDDRVVGTVFETPAMRYFRMGGLIPPDAAAEDEAQAAKIFDDMHRALGLCGMRFAQVARTWFFNRDILAWYTEFNRVRDRFFKEEKVFEGLVPASTGIAGGNSDGVALVTGLLAAQPKCSAACTCALPSPLQCPALEYGSSFSRAVEIAEPGLRRVLISGTASIAPEGHSMYIGDVDAQVARTMEVAGAILESRGMTWEDTTRAIVYFKNAGDISAFGAYCAENDIYPIPAVPVHNDVCRDDLLFEIELDALVAE